MAKDCHEADLALFSHALAMPFASKVPSGYHGQPLLDYLAARFTYLPREEWRRLLLTGKVSSQGERCSEAHCVTQGEIIACELPPFEEPDANFAYRIVHEDDWLLAIDKPANLRVHGGGRFIHANLVHHLRHRHQPPYPEVDLVHRLDADTSGLVLLARDKEAVRRLTRQFATGEVEKFYLAVVLGVPPPEGTIDLPIGPLDGTQVPRFAVDHLHGKPAVTHYRLLRSLGTRCSLLELRPETGRTHQLRVHLAALGHPLVGDALYTMNDADYLYHRCHRPAGGLSRHALHCHALSLRHPLLHTPLTLTAPLAADIAAFLREAETAGEGQKSRLS